MKEYKYSISMTYIHNNEIIDIKSENIKSLVIDSDYINNNMPKIFAIIVIDKNIIDKIILNAESASMKLDIYKFVSNSDVQNKELYIRGEFSYFISGDINYNKDIDYMDDENKKDVYKKVTIGMLSKSAIDNNNKTYNTTLLNSAMMSIVNDVTKHMPILIEPFTYNKIVNQLLLLPYNRVSKTLKFLNSIAVFYSTPYRFFIDFDTAYLISSSGKAVPRKKDLYSSVVITMYKINDKTGDIAGMDEDSKNKCYKVDINAIDSNYKIDKNKEKDFNNLAVVLDSSRDKSQVMTKELSNAMTKVTSAINTINKSFNKILTDITKGPTTLNANTNLFNSEIYNLTYYRKNEFDTIITALKAAIDAAPAPVPPEGSTTVTATDRTELKNKITTYANNVLNCINTDVPTVKTIYTNSTNKTLDQLVTVGNTKSYVNGVNPINMQDNTNSIISLYTTITNNNTNITSINTQLKTALAKLDVIPTNIQLIISLVSSSTSDISADTGVAAQVANLQTLNTKVKASISNLNSYSTYNSNILSNIPGFTSSLGSSITNLINVNVNLKGLMLGTTTITSALNTRAKNILNTINKTLSSTTGGILSITSLVEIQKNLNSFNDISSLGNLGISKFYTQLNLESASATQKNKIVRVNNDNTNMVKNMKAKAESSSVRLSINKNNLDASVFTINKEYTVKNYDVHNKRDGKFILISKKELYIREDENFTVNVMLDFNIVKS